MFSAGLGKTLGGSRGLGRSHQIPTEIKNQGGPERGSQEVWLRPAPATVPEEGPRRSQNDGWGGWRAKYVQRVSEGFQAGLRGPGGSQGGRRGSQFQGGPRWVPKGSQGGSQGGLRAAKKGFFAGCPLHQPEGGGVPGICQPRAPDPPGGTPPTPLKKPKRPRGLEV